jgi:hypothetical protein
MAEARAAHETEAVRLRQEAMEERHERSRRETERQEARIIAAGGPDALDLLERRAYEAGECGWHLGGLEVCHRPADRFTFVWCRMHNRQLDREQEAKRRARSAPEGVS